MGNVIKGWKPASRFLSGIPVRTLRKAVEAGALHGTKSNGIWSFLDADLLAFAAAIGKAVPKAPTTVVNATTAMPSTSAPAVPPTALGAVTSGWLLAAATPVSARVDDEDDDAGVGHEPPFWAASSVPMYPEGEPVVDPVTRVITYMPLASNAPGTHAPGTLGAFVAELQAQLATTQAQLAATTAACEQWRTAWRTARTSAIANAIMNEATNAGVSPMSVDSAWRAAGAAADGLPDDQLANEAYAVGVGRAAGNAAAMRAAAASGFGGPDLHGGDHDLARARMRRGRSRSPRW